jgi:UDP-N-acetylmuramoylalanine--D-glutamate ligase
MSIFSKHYLIVGASSVTGLALIQFLSHHKASYSLSDIKKDFFTNIPTSYGNKPPIFIYDNEIQDKSQLKDIDEIILSPGVPRNLQFLQQALIKGIPIISEITFSYRVLEHNKKTPTLLGITGSNGKSTTCYLLYEIIKKLNKDGNTYLLGNFGTPLISKVDEISKKDMVILELSSYQLEDAQNYHIHGASILNITPNHLDRYNGFEEYKKAKLNILSNQNQKDFVIINKPLQKEVLSTHPQSDVLTVNSLEKEQDSVFCMDEKGNIFFKNSLFLEQQEIPLGFRAMKENLLIIFAFIEKLNYSLEKAKKILKESSGLEHRQEVVSTKYNVTVINDSKATTPEAVKLNLIGGLTNIILIMGGRNKDLDFSVLKGSLNEVHFIVFYGESGQELQAQIGFKENTYIKDFKKAVYYAYDKALKKSPSTLLLSTGCASFDQFSSYKERGKVFKELIYDLQK